MTTIEAGTQVKKGYYFSAKSWTLQPMPRDGEALPGAAGEKYIYIPLLLAFIVAPLMGAAFLMFLPFIGFYLFASALVRPFARVFGTAGAEVAATMSPGWVPGEAHLAGKPGEDKATGDAKSTDGLEQVADEVAKRRENK